jgi:hypothetical protein
LRRLLRRALCGGLIDLATTGSFDCVFDAPGIALWGAALVATSPVFLYQLMNAMSDVPVTAAWTLTLVLALARRPLLAGLAMSATIAIRPNLAPLAGVVMAWTALSEAREAGTRRRVCVAADGAGRFRVGDRIAVFNARVYESPLTSGYGATSDLYAPATLDQPPAVRRSDRRRRRRWWRSPSCSSWRRAAATVESRVRAPAAGRIGARGAPSYSSINRSTSGGTSASCCRCGR